LEIHQSSSKTFRKFYKRIWLEISQHQKLSENFIKEFRNKVSWYYISRRQRLSENFIKEFRNKVSWYYISRYQKLSEDFIREFKDEVDWSNISKYQTLSEDFIREFKDRVDWIFISRHQKLSEDFIKEFQDKVYWREICIHQTLSKKFLKEFSDKINIKLYNKVHQKKTREQKIEEMKQFAQKWNLKFDGKYLYAFRGHDISGRGSFRKTQFYEKGKYYRDWKCDMRENIKFSFGFTIQSGGNISVKVSVKDWGVAVKKDLLVGKARVWGFTVLE